MNHSLHPYRVTAIVSTYNSEFFIEECLNDLIGQTLYGKDQLEIIIIDSGSTQNEADIVQRYASKYPHIIYNRTHVRESIYAAWNKGIRQAHGKYITNANTDDRHRKDALEILANALDSNESIDVVYADQLITDISNQTFDKVTPVGQFTWPEFSFETLLEFCCIGPQPMWRKIVHKRYNKYFNETLEVAGDYDFWLSIANKNFKKINLTLGLYYRSKDLTNKEFQNIQITQCESYHAREQAFRKYAQNLSNHDVYKIIEKSITLIFDPCVFLLQIESNGRILRLLEHKCWIICMLLESQGLGDIALNFAQRQASFFPDFYNLKFYITSSKNNTNINKANNFEQILKILPKNDIFYVSPKHEAIQLFFKHDCDQKKLLKRSVYFQHKISNLLKNNPNLEELEYNFFCLIILLCKLNKISDAKKLATDFYLSFGGTARLSLVFRQALLSSAFIQSTGPETPPLVSVVIPLFNQGIYLHDSVTSVLNQSYRHWELIIVNDGSTDNSLQIAHNIFKQYRNHPIKIIDQENKGKGFTRNKGVSISKGQYVCILDADDMLGSTYLEEAISCLQKNPEVGWITPMTLQFGRVHQIFYHFNFDLKEALTVCPSPISSVFRRELWDEVEGFDESMVDREDWDFWIKALECGWSSLHTTTPQFMYRIQERRFGERSDININSKLQIIQRHPWWYKNLSREKLIPLCTQFATGTFPPDVLNFANIHKMTALPKNRDVRKRLFTQIKDDWMSQNSHVTQPDVNPKAASLLRLASHYAEKGDHAKAEKYREEARKVQ